MLTPNCKKHALSILKSPQLLIELKKCLKLHWYSVHWNTKYKVFIWVRPVRTKTASVFSSMKQPQKTQVHWNSWQCGREFIVCLCSVYQVIFLDPVKLRLWIVQHSSKLLSPPSSPVTASFPMELDAAPMTFNFYLFLFSFLILF